MAVLNISGSVSNLEDVLYQNGQINIDIVFFYLLSRWPERKEPCVPLIPPSIYTFLFSTSLCSIPMFACLI